MVPNGLMLREKRFGSIGLRLVVTTIASGIVAIAAAFLGAGAYALVFQAAASSAIVFVWNVVARPIRALNIHFAAPLKRIISYSGYQFGFSVINYFARNLDTLLVGKTLGAAAAGNYDKAYKLTGYPLSAFSSVVASVVQPYMAEHQDSKETVFSYWIRIEKGAFSGRSVDHGGLHARRIRDHRTVLWRPVGGGRARICNSFRLRLLPGDIESVGGFLPEFGSNGSDVQGGDCQYGDYVSRFGVGLVGRKHRDSFPRNHGGILPALDPTLLVPAMEVLRRYVREDASLFAGASDGGFGDRRVRNSFAVSSRRDGAVVFLQASPVGRRVARGI